MNAKVLAIVGAFLILVVIALIMAGGEDDPLSLPQCLCPCSTHKELNRNERYEEVLNSMRESMKHL